MLAIKTRHVRKKYITLAPVWTEGMITATKDYLNVHKACEYCIKMDFNKTVDTVVCSAITGIKSDKTSTNTTPHR